MGGDGGDIELAYCEAVSFSSTNRRSANPASVSPDPRRIGFLGVKLPTAINLMLHSLDYRVILRDFADPHKISVGPPSRILLEQYSRSDRR